MAASDQQDISTRTFTVTNKHGMHARPAAMFVKAAGRYQAEITVEHKGVEVNGKSIMGLLTIEGYQGADLTVCAKGPDAEEAIAAIADLFQRNFDEDE